MKQLENMTDGDVREYLQLLANATESIMPGGPSKSGRALFVVVMFDTTRHTAHYTGNSDEHTMAIALEEAANRVRQNGELASIDIIRELVEAVEQEQRVAILRSHSMQVEARQRLQTILEVAKHILAPRPNNDLGGWTRETPTETGNYWFWGPNQWSEPVLLRVGENDQGLFMDLPAHYPKPKDMNGYWMKAVRPLKPKI